jgi:CRP-like cAMP-binding protein
MAANPQLVELLRTTPLFAHVPVRSLEKVAAMAKVITHRDGTVIVRQGAGAHAFHIIVSGQADVSADGVPVATLGPGEHFGEIAVIESGKRTASVTAVGELRVIAIDAVSFRRLVRSDSTLAAALPAEIADRLQDLDRKRPD